jgi:hypothetical protein
VPLTRFIESCSATGWLCERRGDQTVVSLEAAGERFVARVTAHDDLGIHCVASLDAIDGYGDESRRAVDTLLSQMESALPNLRVRVGTDDNVNTVMVGVVVPPIPTDEDVDRALSVLTCACHLSVREVRALSDSGVARAYISVNRTGEFPQHPKEQP